MRLIAAVLSCLVALPAWSLETFVFDPEHTFPSFEIRHQNISTFRGKFTRSQGRAVLDPQGPDSQVELVVDASSGTTGHDGLDRKLAGMLFFNAGRFPEIRFSSNQVEFVDAKPVRVHGQMTLLGVTRPVTLEVRDYACGHQFLTRRPMCGADVHAVIRRSDFGMTFGIPGIGDEVRLAIEVEGFRQ